MKKRRRAYKAYAWRKHCLDLMTAQLDQLAAKKIGKAIDIAILYGDKAVGWKESESVIKAGPYEYTVTLSEPYKKAVNW